jgi:TRAP-type transport system small permease protein
MSTGEATIFAPGASIVRLVTYLMLTICGVITVIALCALSAEIILRYAFNAPMEYVHEATMIGFTFVYLLGAAALYARNDDIIIEYFFNFLPATPARILILIIYLATAAVMILLFVQTIALMDRQLNVPTPSLRLPLAIYGLPLAIMSAFIAFCSFVEAWACAQWIRTGIRPVVWPEDMWKDDEICKPETL